MSSAYGVAPIFLIRLAGAPFDVLERLATPAVISLARELADRRKASAKTRNEAEVFFRSPERTLSETAFRALRTAVRLKRPPVGVTGEQPPVFANYAKAAAEEAAIERQLEVALERELIAARRLLWESARIFLPRYLIFSTGGVRELLAELFQSTGQSGPLSEKRNAKAGDRERHLLLYLQRICGKNDTFSEFGPTVWGRSDPRIDGIELNTKSGIDARDTYFERWVAHAIAALINNDPEAISEFSPRLNPRGRWMDHTFVLSDTAETISLSPEEQETLRKCDGKTPFHVLAVATVRHLLEKQVLVASLEVPALEPKAFEILYGDVRNWRPGKTRDKWLSILEPLEELPGKFAKAESPKLRREILDDAGILLQAAGATRKAGERFLYSAWNPIGEECFRDCRFNINEELLNQVTADAAPWIDLWRDTYAFVAGRAAAGLRPIFQRAAGNRSALPLPEFLKVCEMAKLPLTGPGLVALATIAFQEVKSVFREQLGPHLEKAEYELTAEDCHVVRRRLQYAKFDEYTYPSADIQISAESPDAVKRGQYQWILSELHPPVAMLHHCMYWACPDKKALNEAFRRTLGNRPNFHFGFFAADFTAHTAVRLFDALPDLSYFVAPQRSNPAWQTISPAETEVYVDNDTRDICLRRVESHEYLGSFARAWVIPLGFHPFQFGFAPHTPRLRCGRVIVQRRSWTVTKEEFPSGDFAGVSRDLIAAVDQLRAQKNWPRHIFVRPSERALRRSGAEGRDKDTKPIYIDLESYMFHEIFYRWLTKAGELEVTEMLPGPDDLIWREPDGRRTFELRTMIVPRT